MSPNPSSELADCVRRHGLPRPVLMSRSGEVMAGKALLSAAELSPHPGDIRLVDSAQDAALMSLAAEGCSVVETADLVAVLAGQCRGLGTQGKRSVVLSKWLEQTLGRSTGFSPRQVEWYLRLASASTEEREQVATAQTLSAAARMLGWASTTPRKAAPNNKPSAVSLAMGVLAAVQEGPPVTSADQEVVAGLLRAALAVIEERNVCAPHGTHTDDSAAKSPDNCEK
jgi:hypothetical protein